MKHHTNTTNKHKARRIQAESQKEKTEIGEVPGARLIWRMTLRRRDLTVHIGPHTVHTQHTHTQTYTHTERNKMNVDKQQESGGRPQSKRKTPEVQNANSRVMRKPKIACQRKKMHHYTPHDRAAHTHTQSKLPKDAGSRQKETQ